MNFMRKTNVNREEIKQDMDIAYHVNDLICMGVPDSSKHTQAQ